MNYADATDDELAVLPFWTAQSALVGASVQAFNGVSCGWHGSTFDLHPGVVALVQTGGPLAALVGERVAVSTYQPTRSVNVYIHGEADTFEAISLTRRAFLAIGPLWADQLNVRVEVLG